VRGRRLGLLGLVAAGTLAGRLLRGWAVEVVSVGALGRRPSGSCVSAVAAAVGGAEEGSLLGGAVARSPVPWPATGPVVGDAFRAVGRGGAGCRWALLRVGQCGGSSSSDVRVRQRCWWSEWHLCLSGLAVARVLVGRMRGCDYGSFRGRPESLQVIVGSCKRADQGASRASAQLSCPSIHSTVNLTCVLTC